VNNLGTITGQTGTLLLTQYVNNTGTVTADGAAVMLSSVGNQLVDGQWIARNDGTDVPDLRHFEPGRSGGRWGRIANQRAAKPGVNAGT
jgi:hypothetical protein